MNYYSLNGDTTKVNFREAVLNSIAPDKGLYFPEDISKLSPSIIKDITQLTKHELCYEAIKQFVGDCIPKEKLISIIQETLNFETPVKKVNNEISVLELFHGPTLAFKDVGARFMAKCLGYFLENSNKEITVLVATSGDTGGAVAHGFYKVKGIKVVILYPKGKVSNIQEKQLTTLGENIYAFEVEGDFDDCQNIVKQAFIDKEINKQFNLTSANSINVARWLPQMFYYLNALQQVDQSKETIFSVPSGNFGNICAGIMAQNIGIKINHFIAATNNNNVVTRFLDSNLYQPLKTIPTISNAMDVSDPSNFVRIQKIYSNYLNLKEHLTSYSFNDLETRNSVKSVFENDKYMMDPHGAVAFMGVKKYLEGKEITQTNNVFLETAHPVKFIEVVEDILNIKVKISTELQDLVKKDKKTIESSSNYLEFKNKLIDLIQL
ncbi:MAG: threonine synthase [Solirubrobacteraceae bacterium]